MRGDGRVDGSALAEVLAYHDQSTHRPGRYAPGPGHLDWATQPDPFRGFEGAPRVALDRPEPGTTPLYPDLFEPGEVPPAPLDRASLSQLLFDSLALSAWKQAGASRWSLRVNPSSGNLHPTEGYLLLGPVPGVADRPGLWHYRPFDHSLERRRELPGGVWEGSSSGLSPGSFLVGLASIPWRESWKYGERAFRYCQHDAGHALAALSLAAAALGWVARPVPGIPDPILARVLAIDDQVGPEAEHPDLLLAIGAQPPPPGWRPPRDWFLELAAAPTQGVPNRLSPAHRAWPALDRVAEATLRDGEEPDLVPADPLVPARTPPGLSPPAHPARALLRQRRSAVDLDGRTPLSRRAFARLLERVMPRPGRAPFAALEGGPDVHLLAFVHRVGGLAPGLYLLPRAPGAVAALRAACTAPGLAFSPAWLPGVPELLLLARGDLRGVARAVSCGQDIASDGVVAFAMLAPLEPGLRRHGTWYYRRLHWECGAVGQVLYLEAEATGIRATGIGCFLDDEVHDLLGLAADGFRSLYHFTLGGPVDDPRLGTLDPYGHLEGS